MFLLKRMPVGSEKTSRYRTPSLTGGSRVGFGRCRRERARAYLKSFTKLKNFEF